MNRTPEYSETSSKKGRGRARRSLDLIAAMHAAAAAAQPITGRGIGYKLFTAGLIPSMARSEMQRVYRLLKEAREQGDIPWEWIVDETRSLERTSTWADPAAYARAVARSYRRDFWDQQPARVEVWSEKGTIRGVLAPVLDQYAVGFRVMHGFSSATSVHDVADDDDGRDLIALYVGDYDPSGLFMSEQDLPARLTEYDGHHVDVRRIALTGRQVADLPSFPASDKSQRPALPMVLLELREELLGTRCDGPQQSSRLCRNGHHGPDRAGGVAALRHRQQSRAAIVADDPRPVGCAMTHAGMNRHHRHCLPQRRGAIAVELEHAGHHFRMQIGSFPDGTLGEVFLDAAKQNSGLDAFAADAAILVSLLLQHGATPAEIGHALRRAPDGTAAGLVGAVVDRLAEMGRQ